MKGCKMPLKQLLQLLNGIYNFPIFLNTLMCDLYTAYRHEAFVINPANIFQVPLSSSDGILLLPAYNINLP